MAVDALTATFGALADPTRRAILDRLSKSEATVLELAEPFAISLPAISRHLKVLEQAGLISRGRQAQWRPCKIETQALEQLDNWVGHYRTLWDGRFDRMDGYLATLTKGEPDAQQ